MNDNPFLGSWTYRSFLRDPDINTDFNDLRFGAGNMEFVSTVVGIVKGTLGGTDWSLNLNGWWSLDTVVTKF